MSENTLEKKEEFCSLVKKQKKAKISWLSMITELPEESIIKYANHFGFIIDDEYICDPSSMSVSQTSPSKPLTDDLAHSRLYQSEPTSKPLIKKDPVMYGTVSLSMAALSICAGPMLILVLFLIV